MFFSLFEVILSRLKAGLLVSRLCFNLLHLSPAPAACQRGVTALFLYSIYLIFGVVSPRAIGDLQRF